MNDTPTRRGRIEDAHKRLAILLGSRQPGPDYAMSVSFWLEPPESGKPGVPTFNSNFECGSRGLVTLTTWQWNPDVVIQHELMLGSEKVEYTMVASPEHETLTVPHFWTTELDQFFDVKDVPPPLLSDEERRTLEAKSEAPMPPDEFFAQQRREAALPGEDERKFYEKDRLGAPRTALGGYEDQAEAHEKVVEKLVEAFPLLEQEGTMGKSQSSPVGAVSTHLGFSVKVVTGMYQEQGSFNHVLWVGLEMPSMVWNDAEHDSVPQSWSDELRNYLNRCANQVLRHYMEDEE